ncbi:LVIVD repeat-containing protein [Neolewinella antarctica]|uniref:Choice-of-anchor B domain-containing protein n=1 Tax=Neolewinella antarctica TaxID=442734 RepID=A0ABX0XA59_9BACT|nr:choice-of-anchor B family protein [Neolewinella antarctica]NJC25866.1 choice-of-anchor B domain-containing protein [Neolewinella antarctica]
MFKKLSFFTCLALLLPVFPGTGVRAQQAENMTFLGSWDDQTLERYSDLWGYAAGGKEYALLGSASLVHILDVTDPANITELHRLNSYENSSTIWRDIKVYGDYAYCVTDRANEGLQIIDLRDIENTRSEDMIVYSSTAFFAQAHNLFIDETTDPVRLYAFGTDSTRNGYIALSLADPINPVMIGNVDLSNNGGYIHDGYAINDTLYANSEARGMYVYDVSQPDTAVELGLLSNYVEAGYNHSVWRTPDGTHAVMCDETPDRGVKIVNVENPLDMEVVGLFRSTLSDPTSDRSLAHNPYVLDDDRVVMSYYGDGIQVWDISDKENPTRLGYYDTTPKTTAYGNGVWGAYPYLPSGNIIGSDILNGLFVVALDGALPVTYTNWSVTGDGKNAMLDWSVAAEVNNAGWSVEHALEGGTFAEIAFVAAGERENHFLHEAPGPGVHYYRLRQMDLDGVAHLSEVRTVEFAGLASAITVFPNPARVGQTVALEGADAGAGWSLWTVGGQLVRRGVGARLRVDVPAGAYYLRVGEEVVGGVVFLD